MTTSAVSVIAELPVLYVKPGCKTCEEIMAFLDEHGIGYREVDIIDRPSGRTEVEKKTGQSAVPVLDWHGRVLMGFDKEELVGFLQSRDVKLEDS
jgi:glutaredoxin